MQLEVTEVNPPMASCNLFFSFQSDVTFTSGFHIPKISIVLNAAPTKTKKSTLQIELGNMLPQMDKLVQLIGIILLFSVGLSGCKNIYGKKRAWSSIRKTTITILDESKCGGVSLVL